MSPCEAFLGHSEHSALPSVLANVLFGHPMQDASEVAFSWGLYFPTPQSVHASGPVVFLYLPASQAWHSPLLAAVNPFSHVQFSSMVLPTAEVLLSGHGVHSDMPVSSAYFPASQTVQSLSSVIWSLSPWYLPMLQSKHSVCPNSEYLHCHSRGIFQGL